MNFTESELKQVLNGSGPKPKTKPKFKLKRIEGIVMRVKPEQVDGKWVPV
jgi:hypothetical protein